MEENEKTTVVTNKVNQPVSAPSTKMIKGLSVVSYVTVIFGAVMSVFMWIFRNTILNDILSMMLYTVVACNAAYFLKGKNKWVKIVFAIAVTLLFVCIVVPLIIELVKSGNTQK